MYIHVLLLRLFWRVFNSIHCTILQTSGHHKHSLYCIKHTINHSSLVYSHTSVSNIALLTITERLAAALTAVEVGMGEVGLDSKEVGLEEVGLGEVGMGPGAPTISATVSSTSGLVTICP